MLSRLTGAPLIFDFQGSLTGEMLDHNFIKKSSKLFKPMAWLEHRIDHLPKAILTSSLHGAGLLREQFDVPAGRIHPIPDCVDAVTFDPGRFNRADQTALKEAWGIPLNKKLIVYAGILTEYQGTGHLLQALKLLRDQRDDFHLLLMGFPSVEHYRMIATQLGVADLITFTGKMPYESLPIHLSLGDVATAPKLSATEGCGKILNYMSMALPTVVYDTAVSREFLGQLGIYAQERTAAGLALALGQSLDLSHQERTAIGATLRQWVTANYSWERTARQIEWVYAAVLAGHPQPAFVAKRALI
jgi:glycosyltransferase involved in cell wall biosynthesis